MTLSLFSEYIFKHEITWARLSEKTLSVPFLFLDALASLKTMFKIQLLMFSRILDFKSITEYYRV